MSSLLSSPSSSGLLSGSLTSVISSPSGSVGVSSGTGESISTMSDVSLPTISTVSVPPSLLGSSSLLPAMVSSIELPELSGVVTVSVAAVSSGVSSVAGVSFFRRVFSQRHKRCIFGIKVSSTQIKKINPIASSMNSNPMIFTYDTAQTVTTAPKAPPRRKNKGSPIR